MKISFDIVKREGTDEVWSHPSVLMFSAKIDQGPGTSCAAICKSPQETINDVQAPKQRKEESQESGAETPATSTGRGRTGLELQIPVLKDLRAKLGIDFGTCLGKSEKKERCKRRISMKNLAVAEGILKRLERGDCTIDNDEFSKLLRNLAELLHCKKYHQKYAPVLSERWEVTVGLRTEPTSAQGTVRKPRSTKPATQHDQFDTSKVGIRKFVPYDAKGQSMISTENFVGGAITAKLGKREIEKAGHIYIYGVPGNFGHSKIGVTSRPVEVRLREWERKCGYETYLDFATSQVDQEPIPHVYRVEKIVQAQLRNCRKKEIKCTRCGECHRELFEVFKEAAIAEVLKWSAWMRSNPYEELANGDWKLKKGQKAIVKMLCQSMPSEKQKRCISTSYLKEREEKNRQLSALPHLHRRTDLRVLPRRSERLAAKQRKERLAASEVSDVNSEGTLKLEL
ncbi:MAG: hypothetical protein LQ343_005469 [Gyalolechia ehrenbergii]|nr:MAG: hypothetical protein LQ343_005469 [Gyalolechia ehrenbergii]